MKLHMCDAHVVSCCGASYQKRLFNYCVNSDNKLLVILRGDNITRIPARCSRVVGGVLGDVNWQCDNLVKNNLNPDQASRVTL